VHHRALENDSRPRINKVHDSLFSKESSQADEALIRHKTLGVVGLIMAVPMIAGLTLDGKAVAARRPEIGSADDLSGTGATFDKSQKAARDLYNKNLTPKESGYLQPFSWDHLCMSGGRHDQSTH
jgi:hypothetical protein